MNSFGEVSLIRLTSLYNSSSMRSFGWAPPRGAADCDLCTGCAAQGAPACGAVFGGAGAVGGGAEGGGVG